MRKRIFTMLLVVLSALFLVSCAFLDKEETPVEELFSLNIIYKHQVKVTEQEFLSYCERTFRPREKSFN